MDQETDTGGVPHANLSAQRFLLLQQGCPVLDVARDVALMPGGISNAGGDHLMQLFSAEPLQPCDGSFGVGGARLRLLGAHQLLNAAAAVRASWELAARGWRVSADSVREGLAMTTLPGRFEVLRR